MEATENKDIMLKNIPPAMAAAYKKRFPNFWHIHEGIRVHSGKGYDAEEVSSRLVMKNLTFQLIISDSHLKTDDFF